MSHLIQYITAAKPINCGQDRISVIETCLGSIAQKVYNPKLDGLPTYYVVPEDGNDGGFAVGLHEDGIAFVFVDGGIRNVLREEHAYTDRFGVMDWLEVQAAYCLATNPTPAPDGAKRVRIWVEYEPDLWGNETPVDCYLADESGGVLWFDTKREAEEFLAGYEAPARVECLTIVE